MHKVVYFVTFLFWLVICGLIGIYFPVLAVTSYPLGSGRSIALIAALIASLIASLFLWRRLVPNCYLLLLAYVSYVFFKNTFARGFEDVFSVLLLTFTVAVVLILGLIDGFEIAFTLLETREYDRFEQDKLKVLLSAMRVDKELFYDTKEWIVVVLVVALTVVSDFHPLYIFHREIDNRWASVGFSLLFTTVTVLWLAQSPSKAIAIHNPVRFLELTSWAWPTIAGFARLIDGAKLRWPNQVFHRLLARLINLTEPRFEPSQIAFYHAALKRYGSSIHCMNDKIEIDHDGSVLATQDGVFYVVRGDRRQFTRDYLYDQPISAHPDGTPIVTAKAFVFRVPNFGETIPPKVTELLECLCSWRSGMDPPDGAILLDHLKPRIQTDWITPERKSVKILIEYPGAMPITSTDAVAVVFQVRISATPKAFRVPEGGAKVTDGYYRTFTYPCRICTVNFHLKSESMVYANHSSKATLHNTLHELEAQRIRCRLVDPRHVQWTTDYPLSGVRYEVGWEVWPT